MGDRDSFSFSPAAKEPWPEPLSALRAKYRRTGNNGVAGRTVQVPCFIQVEQRLSGKDGAAVPAIFLPCGTGTAAYPAHSYLLHDFRTKPKAFHSLQPERLYSVSHRTHSLHKAALPHTWSRTALVKKASCRIADRTWEHFPRGRNPHIPSHRRYTSHPIPICRICGSG